MCHKSIAQHAELLLNANAPICGRQLPLVFYPPEYGLFICPSLWVKQDLNALAILLLFLLSLPSQRCRGVAMLQYICVNADSDSALVPVPAVPCLFNADRFGPFAVVYFCTQKFVGKEHQVHIGILWELEMSHLWDV